MPIERTFQTLLRRLKEWNKAAEFMGVTASDESADLSLAEYLERASHDLSGWVQAALAKAEIATAAVGNQDRYVVARRALAEIGSDIDKAQKLFFNEIASSDRLQDLAKLDCKGGRFQSWVEPICRCIDSVASHSRQAVSSLLECWNDLSEASPSGGVVVRNTAIGHQNFAPAPAPSRPVPSKTGTNLKQPQPNGN